MALSIYGRGSPEQATTENLTDMEALAQRIGLSPARIIILLEDHDMQIAEMLLSETARDILQRHNINSLYTEGMSEEEFQKTPHKIKTKYKITNPDREIEGFLFQKIGAHRISTEESLELFRREFGKKTLVDAFVIRVARNKIGLKTDDKISDNYLFDIALDIDASSSFDGEESEDFDYFLKHPCNQNLLHAYLKEGRTYEDLAEQLSNEWGHFANIEVHQRSYGKADEYAVRNMLVTLKPTDRAALVFGLNHGIIDKNPASLPDQLYRQIQETGQADASQEILVLVDNKTSAYIHEKLKELAGQGNLRTNVTVYDYQLRREWPVLQWYGDAPRIYGWEPDVVVPPPPAPL